MQIFALLETSPPWFITVMGVFGLLCGSFLNVVIHRLPIMMDREWRCECRKLLGLEDPAMRSERYDLVMPRSTCPACGHRIRATDNVPLLSYLALRGRCRGCGARISPRYPLVEALAGIAGAVAAWHFGFGVAALGAAALSWALIALAAIDFDTQLLPDAITLPFLWLGIGSNFFALYTTLEASVIGAIAGYGSLWCVYWLFKLATGKEGMGYGDFKLLAMICAWLGWQVLPIVILLASIIGTGVGLALIVFAAHDRAQPIPFGPYLAGAGWVALIWGDRIADLQLQALGVP